MGINGKLRVIRTKVYYKLLETTGGLFGLVELSLFLRLVLKFLNTNPETPVVRFIYGYTNPLIFPFQAILPDVYWRQTFPIENAALAAMIGYWLVYVIFLQILRYLLKD